MCKSLFKYPLVKLSDDKQKVLFDYPISLENREDIEKLYSYWSVQMEKALKGNSELTMLNSLFQELEVKEFVKFISVPCGCCSECLKDQSRQWAIRILKEASQFENNFFITLTYSDDILSKIGYNLVKDEISKFNKKLKTYLNNKGLKSDFRFYGVGEYGSHTARPHYHVIYFNLDIPDLEYVSTNENGDLIFKSNFIESVWNKGYVYIGSVDVGSACYVARYCDKKKRLTKQEKEELLDKGIVPEFSIMSRRPGVGASYLDDVIKLVSEERYYINFKNSNFSIPLYYSKKLKNILPSDVLEKYEERSRQNSNIKLYENLVKAEITNLKDLNKFNDLNSKKNHSTML